MIRQTSSFFLSFIIHSFILIVLFFTFDKLTSTQNNNTNEKKIFINLHQYSMEKEVVDSVKKVEKKLKKTYKKKDKPKIKKELKIDKTIEKKEKKQKEKKIESKEVIKSKELENKEKIDNTKTQQISNIIEDDNKVEEKLDDEKERIAIEVRELLVRNKYYPKSARRRGIEGVVKVEFLLTKDGKISSLKTFSKHNILSESLKETISRISDQFPQPKSDVLIVVNIKYSLKR